MNAERHDPGRYVTVGECEVCSQLGEVETSFYKVHHDDMARPLPGAAGRLEQVDDPGATGRNPPTIQRCPVCGTYYSYRTSYEFLIGGSEDEETLTRLTPTEARRFLTDEVYARLVDAMVAGTGDAHARTRYYAGKCLAAHHLERKELDRVAHYLFHADAEVRRGAVYFLHELVYDTLDATEILPLKSTLEALERREDEVVARSARFLLEWVERAEARAESSSAGDTPPTS